MTIELPGLPALSWATHPGTADVVGPGALRVVSEAGADWSNDAGGGPQQHAAALLGLEPVGDFSLSARVRVLGERTTFDAGALAIWGDRDHWAKLCFENSPQGQAMVVSVVTNDYSDDCNSTLVHDDAVYLRITRRGDAWVFHSSADGVTYDFVRYFRLHASGPVTVGFLSQAPLGPTCVAEFSEVAYSHAIVSDFRDGS
ncbi:DUF1349 domain-containing protein [Agromyces atrinae]|uniref:DUF1349 domain-containing protein n=1 Tax=Agromyces atrinae TaxID=592376 RepID=A0A4Q2M281_9MICO|nr:DUF1349 domain-containing protein [Agromyces atrinae]NYD68652.1 hypothetical protein [Agromyces atrinae]RXZ86024.1 DUF1349 domain-containing protein [Agromyces atrinae]